VDSEGRLVISGDVTATVEFPEWQRKSTRTTDDLYDRLGESLPRTVSGSVSVDNFPTDFPDSETHTKLDTIHSDLYNDTDAQSVYDHLKQVRTQVDSYLPKLNVDLDTRASEDTLKTVSDRLYDADEAKSVTAILKELRDKAATETTLGSISGQLDIKLSDLRDALKKSTIDTTEYEKSLADIWYQLTQTLKIHEQTPWNPPNLNVDLRSVRRTIHTAPPVSGYGAAWPKDSPWHWIDDTGYTVTETSYTVKTLVAPRLGWLPTRSFILEWGVRARIDTAGETLYVRLRSEWRGVLAEMTFTETSFVDKYTRISVVLQGWEHDQLFVEAYVTGGTGYIDWTKIYFVPIKALEGWEGTHGEGEHFHPIRVDSDGYPLVRIVGCL